MESKISLNSGEYEAELVDGELQFCKIINDGCRLLLSLDHENVHALLKFLYMSGTEHEEKRSMTNDELIEWIELHKPTMEYHEFYPSGVPLNQWWVALEDSNPFIGYTLGEAIGKLKRTLSEPD